MKGSMKLVTAIGMALLLIMAVAGVSWAQEPGYGARDGAGPIIGGEFGPGEHTADGPVGTGPQSGDPNGSYGRRHGNANSLIGTVAATLNMTREELMSRLRAGERIADVAAGQDVPVATVVEAVIAPRQARLQARVAAGELSPEAAEQLTLQMRDRVQDRLDQLGQMPDGGRFVDEDGDGVCDHAGTGVMQHRGQRNP